MAPELSPDFARAVVVATGRAARRVRVCVAGDGAANHVWSVDTDDGSVIVKVRVDRDDDAAREAAALRVLRGRAAPLLLAHLHPTALRARAAQRRALDPLVALEGRVGGVLVCARQPGRVITQAPAGVDDDDVAAVADAVVALHAVRITKSKVLPQLGSGSSVAGVTGVATDLLRDASILGAVSAPTLRSLRRALTLAGRYAERRHPGTRVRALCHGDLRFHNVIVEQGRAHLIDFEFAGVGDPAVDLAMMAVRTPLSDHQELVLLDRYLAGLTRGRTDTLERYFALKPLCAMVGALGGVIDLGLVSRQQRPATSDPAAYVARRRAAIEREVDDALRRCHSLAARPARITKPALPSSSSSSSSRAHSSRLRIQVAVDGTAASGKSVVARALAERCSAPHWNTGAAYRLVALLALEQRRSPRRADDVDAVLTALRRARPALTDDGAVQAWGRRLDEVLGVYEVDVAVSVWATLPLVRRAVDQLCAAAVASNHGVLEGRDTTSRLWARAPHRLFLTASLPERARRVVARLGRPFPAGRVARLLHKRDELDRRRALHPLVAGPGVVVIDTTDVDEAAVVAGVIARVMTPGKRP